MVSRYAPGIVEQRPFAAITNPLNRTNCSICLNDFDLESMRSVTLLSCNHIYDTECIDTHLIVRASNIIFDRIRCPECNGEVVAKEQLTSMRNRFNPIGAIGIYNPGVHGQIRSVEQVITLMEVTENALVIANQAQNRPRNDRNLQMFGGTFGIMLVVIKYFVMYRTCSCAQEQKIFHNVFNLTKTPSDPRMLLISKRSWEDKIVDFVKVISGFVKCLIKG